MASSPIPRCAPVSRRSVRVASRRIEPVSGRTFRSVRNSREDQVLYSLAPPAPLRGLERSNDRPEVAAAIARPAAFPLWSLAGLGSSLHHLRGRTPKLQGRRPSRRISLSRDVRHLSDGARLNVSIDEVPLEPSVSSFEASLLDWDRAALHFPEPAQYGEIAIG